MKKIIKIIFVTLFVLFLLNTLWTMIQTKQGLDSSIWLQLVYLLFYLVSAIAAYKEKWFGFFASFLMGVGVMLASIIISL
ncbi:TPA: hypothetical protein U0G85_000812 [Listeria monocytogenes]|uniref:Uncharacterized protein n=2 Tax=Listeria monocytogenes TaxID=1639 RepID=A0A3T2HXL6_LISMN|nr:hypothetical protein [Listeria monocytogenes]EAF3057877.1 hypothetical protein [Listeria monocytogenes serotype 1/2a]EAF4573473.1 hypothetical protein [Listeria monocytogenes serotype 4b]AEO03739.1 hypothetical protein LMOG_00032 [Listeria monocytogenes J0161]ALU80013.1 hypothetical protein AUZ26_05135 [Listeria monocytogenes]AQP65314.1 hypothetical protein B0X19_08595 [Listeria monocytogenes]